MQKTVRYGEGFISEAQVNEILKILTEMETGIRMLKEEFRMGMHISLSSIIRKIDQVMSGSVKRAYSEQCSEPQMEERILQKILTSLNTSNGKQVQRLLKTEREAISWAEPVTSDKINQY